MVKFLDFFIIFERVLYGKIILWKRLEKKILIKIFFDIKFETII